MASAAQIAAAKRNLVKARAARKSRKSTTHAQASKLSLQDPRHPFNVISHTAAKKIARTSKTASAAKKAASSAYKKKTSKPLSHAAASKLSLQDPRHPFNQVSHTKAKRAASRKRRTRKK